MGFYSIYKIIKDIIRTLFGKHALKLIIISIIISIILFTLDKNTTFASYSDSLTTVTLNNASYDIDIDYLTKNYNYYFLCWFTKKVGSYYYNYLDLYCSNQEMTVNYNTTYSNTSVTVPSNSNFITFHLYISSSANNFSSAVLNWNATHFNPSLNNHTYNDNTGIYIDQTVTYNISSSGIYNITLANYNVKNSNNDIIFNNNVFIPPSLSNTTSELENLSFNNFTINANSYTDEIENNDGTLYMLFYNRSLSNSQNTDGLYPIQEKAFTKGSIYTDYENSSSSNMIFSYPIFKSGVFFNVGSTYEIRFAKKSFNSEYNTDFYEFFDNSYTFTISSNVTQDYINQINQQTATTTDEENQQNIENALNNQIQSIDNLNNSITDSTVDNSSINLPTDNTNDPTQNGIENIFQTIYNSFTTGTAQDIVFPIPNTNQNITLSANYIYNSLVNNDASWIIDIIRAFYWYIISRYIIVDINHKIRKIKQGNLEDIQDSNIKEEML